MDTYFKVVATSWKTAPWFERHRENPGVSDPIGCKDKSRNSKASDLFLDDPQLIS